MSVEILSQLKTEFDDAQKFLKSVDENIKRLTGRDPTEIRVPPRRGYGGPEFRVRELRYPPMEFDISGEVPSTPRRGRGGAFVARGGSRLRRPHEEMEEDSPDEDLPRKVTVQSSVVTTRKAPKTRKDTIETQKGDRRGMERNRRMFGMILGTLQKFQSEESKRKEQAQKRAEIEQKLEQAAEEERENLRKEKQGLFLARREKQAQIRRLEQKLEIAQLHEEWEGRQKLLLKFILTPTTTCSPIAYAPKRHTPESLKKLEESRSRIKANIAKQQQIIAGQLAEIDELYRKGGLDEGYEEMEEESLTTRLTDKENVGPLSLAQGSDTLETSIMDIGLPDSIPPELAAMSLPYAQEDEEHSEQQTEAKAIDSIGDQEFEPIYD